MGVLWIIEKAKNNGDGPCIAKALMGDFPVRLFATVDSFQKLLRFNRRQLPDLLLIDEDDCDWALTRLRDSLAYYMPHVPCIIVGSVAGETAELPFQVVAKPYTSHDLAKFVIETLRAKGRRGLEQGILRFRDVQLDFRRMECRIVPDGELQKVPLKEAQLLRLFLEKPGVCLPRDDIRKFVWTDVKVSSRTIDSHVSRLRKRLQNAEVGIQSVYGGGYVLA